ncbi:unnamed protein product [Lactuca saligna]|uniref:Uncharacterized protein n=1 Tax=Lactuca saligna TaxID=75948 RepID=A0AA35YRG4_LACSI|nr:unnamed protein product [Lactuca saligna]
MAAKKWHDMHDHGWCKSCMMYGHDSSSYIHTPNRITDKSNKYFKISNSERRSPLRKKKKSSQFGGGNSGVRTEKLKSGYRELFSREKLGNIADFMSASSLAGIGAPVKLWVDTFALLICFTLCCIIQQSFHLCFSTVSMRLRPKRTCSGVVCFGCFHIQRRAISLFLYLRRPVYTIKNQIFC